jgi:hypothetical protein
MKMTPNEITAKAKEILSHAKQQTTVNVDELVQLIEDCLYVWEKYLSHTPMEGKTLVPLLRRADIQQRHLNRIESLVVQLQRRLAA